MPPTPDRLNQYSQRRLARLGSLPSLRHGPAGPAQAWYVADELLVVDDGRKQVEQYLAANHAAGAGGDEEIHPGLRRYHVTGLDVPGTVRAMRLAHPTRRAVVSPNHVFLSTPFNHGGPFGPPTPTTAAAFPPPPQNVPAVPVAIIDTGLWADTELPAAYLDKDLVDYETATDVDNDGLLDGDVGHANFIAGVIAAHAPRCALRVLKVLDTFGVCTEDTLIAALDRLDPATTVVNLSLGGFTADDAPPLGLDVALENALSGRDRVLVAAAGNNGNRTSPFWPAAFAGAGRPWSSQVVAVAAHDGTDLCTWSNAGSWVTFAAPGQDIDSTFISHTTFFPDGWALWSGTSFAAPRVAAEIAALVTAQTGACAALERVTAGVTAANITFDGYRALL